MIYRTRLALVLIAPVLLVACSDGGDGNQTLPSPTSTCDFSKPEIPANCVETTESVPPTVFPNQAGSIEPVTLPPTKGKLGGADNRADASRKSATFTVTVPKGSRIGSVVGCLGNGTVEVTTVPDSKAYQKIDCNVDAELYSELIVEDNVVLTKATTFTITVTTTAASRWDVAVFGTTAKLGESQS